LSEHRKQYRSWTAQEKIEIVLAGLRGDRSVKEFCRRACDSRRRGTPRGERRCSRAVATARRH